MNPRTRTHHRVLVAMTAALLLFAAACGDDDADDAATPDAAVQVTVADAWARTSPTMATRGAVYAHLTAAADDRLVGASVGEEVAASAEVHETVMDDETGEMAMQEVDGIDLPSRETVALEPGGYHVMLLDLVEPLEPGSAIEVVFVFDEAGEQTVQVEVRDAADSMDDES